MCGFTSAEAVGRNPRLTQGERSDHHAIRTMSLALREQRACKVMMLNYRTGHLDKPFFNMLSISPVVHQGRLMLYLANLQDYSYHMAKLVSTPPSQFCRAAAHFQAARPLPPSDQLSLRAYARPAVFEVADGAAADSAAAGSGGGGGAAPLLQLKRLGWSRLSLEPEHLADRVEDALHQLDARYEREESVTDGDDLFVVNAELSGVACRIFVSTEPSTPGYYRITCMRLGGDTFAYHSAFRQLRDLLGDAVAGAQPLGGAAASRAAPRMPGLMLAPMPGLTLAPMARVASAAAAQQTQQTQLPPPPPPPGAGSSGSLQPASSQWYWAESDSDPGTAGGWALGPSGGRQPP